MARYSPKDWLGVAILMRESSYKVLEALTQSPKGWTQLKEAADLTDGGLQKVLKELLKFGIVEERLLGKKSGFKEKKYALSPKAVKEKIFQKAKELRESLERISLKK